MENNNEMKINRLPAKTWYWLRMNDTALNWNPDMTGCRVKIDGGKEADKQASDFDGIETGAGRDADVLFAQQAAGSVLVADETNKGQTVHVLINGTGANGSSGYAYVQADVGSDMTVIETFGENAEGGSLAFRTRFNIEKDAHIRLVQIFMQDENTTILNDVGSECAENGQLDVLQIFIGKGNLYNGVRTELIGKHASTNMDIGYLGQKKQVIDINLVVNHIGKKTNCNIQVDGTLKDAAEKIFRGSIDFKTGSSDSKGAETENVLLLGDDVVNKTIPLILCAEENVEGSHGATIGELDEDTLFYFASRGIDMETAEDMMTKGKMEVLYRKIQDENTEKLVEKQLAEVMEYDRQEL